MKPLVQSLPRVNGALNTVNLVVVKGDDDARVDRAKVQDEAFTEATPQFHAPGNVRACVRSLHGCHVHFFGSKPANVLQDHFQIFKLVVVTVASDSLLCH
jgi:hypothetical protein